MTGKRFDEIVEAQAQKNAKTIIDKFIRVVRDALIEVDHSLTHTLYETDFWKQPMVVSLLSELLKSPSLRVFPQSILEKEREKVSKQMLETLDIMQQAIIAADNFKSDLVFDENSNASLNDRL